MTYHPKSLEAEIGKEMRALAASEGHRRKIPSLSSPGNTRSSVDHDKFVAFLRQGGEWLTYDEVAQGMGEIHHSLRHAARVLIADGRVQRRKVYREGANKILIRATPE